MAAPNTGVIKTDLEAQLTAGKGGRDSSRKLWSMYFTEAEMELPEGWKGDTCAILASAILFSATVATFIIQSYQLSAPDSGDAAIALLTQVSQQLVDIPHETPFQNAMTQSNASFKSTASAIRVNALWCLSLVVSLTCVLSAIRILVQQRARGYVGLVPCRGTLHKRASMNAYIPSPTKRFGMSRAVETMTILLHISVFLFFAGLIDFLFPLNKAIAFCLLSYTATFAFVCIVLTTLPYLKSHWRGTPASP